MNLEKLARTGRVVAAAALLAAVLQGCGSGDDNGDTVSQAMHDVLRADYARTVAERDAAQAARRTAEAAAAAAQAARAKAEGAAADAREAQAAAETLRDAAVAAQAAAETARTTAQAAKTTAETAARDASAARAKAEGERHVANVDKAVAEQAARTAKAAQSKAEQARAAAEAAQKTAEKAQADAEAAQKAAERAQAGAEAGRDAARQARQRAEAAAAAAKTARTTAETERDAALEAQAKAETERDAAVALLKRQEAAEATQRARVDAAAIENAAGYEKILVPGLDVNGDGDFTDTALGERVPVVGSSTNTVVDTDTFVGYQGSQAKPDSLRIRVWHSGPTVQFTAASGTGSARQTHFRLSTAAGPVLTSLRKQTDVPGGHTRHVYLVTDIEPPRKDLFRDNVPTGVSFTIDGVGAGYHAATGQTRYALVKADNTANTDVINVATTAAITLDPPAALAPTANISNRAVANGVNIPGTYATAPGTYICNGGNNGDCTLALNADGELTMQADGAWLFVPDGLITVVDRDYLIYGAWLLKPDSQVGTAYAAALSASTELNMFIARNIAGLSGKAAYKGAAAGFFAERHIGTATAASGTFTATAELAADFATATTGGTLSGTVRDFIRSDGVSVDWLVTLGQVALPILTPDITGVFNGGFAAGDTSGFASGAVWEGEWGVQLVGNGGTRLETKHPTGVIGTFGAQHGAPVRLTDTTDPAAADAGFAAVIGGFGARKQ